MRRAVGLLLASLGVFGGCGGDEGSSGDAGRVCANACACAERGPPDFSRANTGMNSPSAEDAQVRALVRTNYWRTAAGLAPVHGNALLEQAATAHSTFMATNPASCWQGAHFELDSCAGYTGRDPFQRIRATMYSFASASEVINWSATPEQAIDGWVWTVYHRMPFTDVGYTEAGYGTAAGLPVSGRMRHNTMAFARPARVPTPVQTGVVLFPPPGTEGVPTSFRGDLEGPRPPTPAGTDGGTGRWPSGPVVSVNFPSPTWEITVHRLYDGACAEVAHSYFSHANDPNTASRSRRFAFLYANAPLGGQTTYTVELQGRVENAPWSRTWQFKTR